MENNALRKLADKLNAKYDTNYYDYVCSDCAELLPKNKVRYWPNYCLSFLQKEQAFDNLYIIKIDDYTLYQNNQKTIEDCDCIKIDKYLHIGDVEDIMIDILAEAK